MRIGELAAITGVNPATLRVWERRRAILRPERTTGGHRLYGADDVARVRAVLALVERGIGLSAAAEQVSGSVDEQFDWTGPADDVRSRLWDAIDAFDDRAATAVLWGARAAAQPAVLFDHVLVPTLRRLGAEWRLSPRNIAREHFTSALVRSHLVDMLPSRYRGSATCLAFCPEREQHDIGLLMAAVTLATVGTRVVVLGAHTPSASVDLLLEELRPSVVLVATTSRRVAARFSSTWRRPRGALVVAGGGGFREADQAVLGGIVHAGAYTALPGLVASSLG